MSIFQGASNVNISGKPKIIAVDGGSYNENNYGAGSTVQSFHGPVGHVGSQNNYGTFNHNQVVGTSQVGPQRPGWPGFSQAGPPPSHPHPRPGHPNPSSPPFRGSPAGPSPTWGPGQPSHHQQNGQGQFAGRSASYAPTPPPQLRPQAPNINSRNPYQSRSSAFDQTYVVVATDSDAEPFLDRQQESDQVERPPGYAAAWVRHLAFLTRCWAR